MKLVRTSTSDGLVLSGILSEGDKSKPAIIFVHGFMGNFYTNQFLANLRIAAEESNNAFISIENRGTGVVSEFYTTDQGSRIIGAYNEIHSEAHYDISAWIKFMHELGYKRIILAGHSLGTIKVIRYLSEGEYCKEIEKLILLAPFDKNGYIVRKTGEEYKKFVEVAKQKVVNGNGMEVIPLTYDDFPMSYQTYVSWYEDTDLARMFDFYDKTYNFPILNNINLPVQVIVGTKDEYFNIPELCSFDEAREVLLNNIKDVDFFEIEGANHGYIGYEDAVANMFSEFINK